MKYFLQLLIILCFYLTNILARYERWGKLYQDAYPLKLKRYKIDLDLPPKERWKEFNLEKKQDIHTFLNKFIRLKVYVNFLSRKIRITKNKEYLEEIQAISELIDVPFKKLYTLNHFYEISTFCTSILIRNASGVILHGRNLDFKGYKRDIQALVGFGDFYKNGRLLYSGTILAGFSGIIDGMRYNSFGLSLNMPLLKHTTHFSFTKNKQLPIFNIMRKALETCTTYQEAVDYFQSQKMTTYAYFILSGLGKNEGIILQRNKDKVLNSRELSNHQWFLSQTNYDLNTMPPIKDPRLSISTLRIIFNGKRISAQKLRNSIMTVYPTFNKWTITTIMMCPKLNYINGTLWI